MVERISKEEGRLLAEDELRRAVEELRVAKVLYENDFYYKSVASAYYTIYHATKAALLLKGVAPQTHEGVERMFSLYYIKTKEIEVSIGKIIGRLMKMREEADYYPETIFTSEEASKAIKDAERFLKKIKNLFKGVH